MTMTESKDEEPKKPLSLARPGRLELKKTVDAGHVRQSFPHGRTKTVQVEVKRKRTFAPGAGGRMAEVVVAPEGSEQAFGASAADLLAAEHAARHLTAGERATRLRALEDARRDEEHRLAVEAETGRQTEALARHQAEEAAPPPPEFEVSAGGAAEA
ncbi:MAG: IF-2-associated domain-containing protein, partial [Dongiaceae bacterium]